MTRQAPLPRSAPDPAAGSGSAPPAAPDGEAPPAAPDGDAPEVDGWLLKNRARIERWQRPLVTPWDRLRAWTNMLFVDHGIFRLIYSNTAEVAEGAWRSAQPAPRDIARFARAGGRTVVTLRGGLTFGSLPLEREACARHGLGFETLVMRSRGLPTRDELLAILAFFRRVERPVLFHCKSGADRAGFAAALWLLAVEGRPAAEAARQLSLRFGHVRQSKTGVLDACIAAFEREGEAEGLDIETWAATRYDPEAIAARFHDAGWARLLIDRILKRE